MRGGLKMAALLASLALLSGCASVMCGGYCASHARNSSSLVDFLYPDGRLPPQAVEVPQLRIPLRVGLAFLPANAATMSDGLDAAHRQELLERIKQRFIERKFIAEIVVIPDYYLSGQRGFAGLEGVQRLYGTDLIALVSYDQSTWQEGNDWSLTYLTIVGAYVVKGSRHDVSTLVDLAVVDPATRSLIIRAGGVNVRHGNTTMLDAERRTREASVESFSGATDQMIEHFDAALTKFEADVKSGNARVKMIRKSDKMAPGGDAGGGKFGIGAFDPSFIAALCVVVLLKSRFGQSRRI